MLAELQEGFLMKKVYIVEDLCCANCAAKIEKKVAALDGVENVCVNFLTTKLMLDAAEDASSAELFEQIRKIVRKVDSDVQVREAAR